MLNFARSVLSIAPNLIRSRSLVLPAKAKKMVVVVFYSKFRQKGKKGAVPVMNEAAATTTTKTQFPSIKSTTREQVGKIVMPAKKFQPFLATKERVVKEVASKERERTSAGTIGENVKREERTATENLGREKFTGGDFERSKITRNYLPNLNETNPNRLKKVTENVEGIQMTMAEQKHKNMTVKEEMSGGRQVDAGETMTKNEGRRMLRDETNGTTLISTVTEMGKGGGSGEHGQARQNESSWQTMKYTFILFGASFALIITFIVLELGRPKTDESGQVLEDEFSDLPVIQQYPKRTIRELNYYRKLINEPSREKLLPDALQYPYHQPPYTVVLELKDVLVHPDWTYNTGWRFKKRPGIDQFLETLSGIYEIVVYTAELGMTVFPILDALDPNNLITYKLVRDATNFVDGHHVKDLDKLNRDLNKVIVIDWDDDSIKYNRDNLLQIPRWDGDDGDTVLADLANFLRVIAISEIEDVRDVLRYYKEFPDPIAAFREKQRELEKTMYPK